MGLLAVGVGSPQRHRELHAVLRVGRIGGLSGGGRFPGGCFRGVGGPGGCFRGVGRYGQDFRGGAALRGLGGDGTRGLLSFGLLAAAGQQPPGGIQDAGGQDNGNCHDQGQDTGM